MDATTLAFAGAAEQARLIRAGEVSSREVVEATLARIAASTRRSTPTASCSPSARCRGRPGRRAQGRRDARPLLGVPVAIKDDVDVAGEATAWGTAAHAGPVARDAEVVRRLRAAGAIIIGKTLVPELTMLPATDTTTFGSARNPWDLSRTPGGSSGGSAAAMAAGLCGVALGSDGAGSIRNPSAWTGLFGLKPTRDRVPVAPHDDAWQGLSVNGPMARRVADAALFLDATIERTGCPRAASRAAARAGAAADRGQHQGPARRDAAAGPRGAPGGRGHGGAAARAGARRRRARSGLPGVAVARGTGPDGARRRRRRGDVDAAPRAAGAAHARRRGAGRARRRASCGGRAAEAAQTARLARLWDDVDVLLTPAAADGPYRVGVVGRWGTRPTSRAAPSG